MQRALVLLCLALTVSACPNTASTPQPPDDGHEASPAGEAGDAEDGASDGGGEDGDGDGDGAQPTGPVLPNGALCDTDSDCAEGQLCEGAGCEPGQGRCVDSERMCTRDLAEYCGCDGQVFRGSGSCPGARYAYRGPCDPALEDGEPCTDGRQCRSGQCLGDGLEGCTNGAQGVCGVSECTADLATYCGCNNTEFQASGSCPDRQFGYRGPCEVAASTSEAEREEKAE
ncbi:hypothetical protein ENSA5_33390 [Enhygromyxa salina]|uniref:Uncharacterized protein n=1 Tax=Enhygromyxa salina TaxID=215803 RepID=A0A2S9XXG4_9BACT|nr:hypothetical protein [Enhygromyxa salina]PRP97542.1 hypothetical protein ENSA5_33390 [Enhygromyxa salina]